MTRLSLRRLTGGTSRPLIPSHPPFEAARRIAVWAVHDNWFLIEVVAGMLRRERVLAGPDVERCLAVRGFRCDYGLSALPPRAELLAETANRDQGP